MMKTIDIDDPDATELVIGHDGRPVRVVRDGRVVRVPMRMRDSNTVAGEIAADRQRLVDLAGDDGLALHRPGARRLADENIYDAARAAYEQMIADKSAAWRNGPGGGQRDASSLGTEYRGKPGDACTVRAGAGGGWIEGSPGHLAYVNVEGKDVLICVPNGPSDRRSDSTPVLDWRMTNLTKLVRDAEAVKQQAYETACAESERAWMRLGSQ